MLALFVFVCLFIMPPHSYASDPPLGLEDLEKMALQYNPAIAQAAEGVASAEGRKVQAGLYPNPVIGYAAEDLAARAPGRSKHFLFVEQTFITADKLQLSAEIFAREQLMAGTELRARRQQVLDDVRILYYAALGAQMLADLNRRLAETSAEAVGIAEELFNIGQADRPDVLAAEIEAQQAELALSEAENRQAQAWKMLAAAVGNPSLPRSPLAGDLENNIPAVSAEEMMEKVLRDSTRIKIAGARIERARSVLRRAEAGRVPDISLRLGLGYNFEEAGGEKRTGTEGFLEVGVPLPVFDRNQGAIASARAELRSAGFEVRRLEMDMRSLFSSIYSNYLASLLTTERYRKEILPRAKRAHDLYLEKFRQMAAPYTQVLATRRNYLRMNAEYVKALVNLRQDIVRLQGMSASGGPESP